MSFPANWPGACNQCGAEFDEGDEIEYKNNGVVLTECCGVDEDEYDFDPDDDCPERFI